MTTELLVARREAEPLLGYAPGSLKVAMRQQPGRWPSPVACRVRDRALQWDLGQLRAAVAVPDASRSRRHRGADADGLVTCLSCGRRYRSLGPHLARTHHITAREYRAMHHLPATSTLMATDTRAVLSAARIQLITDDPAVLENMRAATPGVDHLGRLAAEGRSATDELPVVRAARAAAAAQARVHSSIRAAARRDELAQAAGYRDFRAAIEATRSLSARRAAELLGVGATTVKRWRGWLWQP